MCRKNFPKDIFLKKNIFRLSAKIFKDLFSHLHVLIIVSFNFPTINFAFHPIFAVKPIGNYADVYCKKNSPPLKWQFSP